MTDVDSLDDIAFYKQHMTDTEEYVDVDPEAENQSESADE